MNTERAIRILFVVLALAILIMIFLIPIGALEVDTVYGGF